MLLQENQQTRKAERNERRDKKLQDLQKTVNKMAAVSFSLSGVT